MPHLPVRMAGEWKRVAVPLVRAGFFRKRTKITPVHSWLKWTGAHLKTNDMKN